jgi:hypothetical protein
LLYFRVFDYIDGWGGEDKTLFGIGLILFDFAMFWYWDA